MKKFLAVTLALTMALSMLATNASAAYLDDANHITENSAGNADTAGVEVGSDASKGDEIGSADIPVYIQAETDRTTTNVYAISYDVSELVFVFSGTEESIWNPETLKYEIAEADGSWDKTNQNITVYNYSDIPVKVTPSNTTPTDTGVNVTLGSALELASAFDGDVSKAGTVKSGTISVTIDGDPVSDYADNTLLTTITLAVTDNRN